MAIWCLFTWGVPESGTLWLASAFEDDSVASTDPEPDDEEIVAARKAVEKRVGAGKGEIVKWGPVTRLPERYAFYAGGAGMQTFWALVEDGLALSVTCKLHDSDPECDCVFFVDNGKVARITYTKELTKFLDDARRYASEFDDDEFKDQLAEQRFDPVKSLDAATLKSLDRVKELGGTVQFRKGEVYAIWLMSESVTDKDIEILMRFPSIRSVNLATSPITDEGLPMLQSLKYLEDLCLVETAITDKAIPILSQMTQLKELMIRKTRISPTAARTLKAALPKCEVAFDDESD